MSESHPEWAATTAGLLVLRLVDAWLTEGSQAPQVSVAGLRAVRGAVEAIPGAHAARAILGSIVDTIECASMPDIRPLTPRLMAYARHLEFEGQWTRAIDVYQALLQELPPELAGETVIDGYIRLGRCFRVLRLFDQSAAAFASAKQAATRMANVSKVLHVEIGEAMLTADRGNLPRAESMLDHVIAATAAEGLDDIRSIALHNRAFIANARGQHEPAARFAYEALRHNHSLRERDRILGDLAESLMALGALDAARDAFLVLATTGDEQEVRWISKINLMQVGAQQMNEALVERYRREMLDEPLPPALRGQYHYSSALGYGAFGRLEPAERALAQAERVAEEHQLNQLLFQVETMRKSIQQGIRAQRRAESRATPAIQDIADAVAEMREMAGV